MEPRVGSFANPVADQPGAMVLGDEPADGKKGTAQASFEVEGETTPSSANGAARGTSPVGASSSLRGSVSTALVVPESLETEEGTEEVERWKDTLVEHAVAGKENHRDRKKRLAANSLERSNVIDPNGQFRRKWDFIQMLLLTYVAFGVPYRIGFAHHVILWSGWFWFDVFCDLFFVADIWVSFRTAFYNVRAELVVEQRLISKHYLRTWFVVDVAACFRRSTLDLLKFIENLPPELREEMASQMHWIDGVSDGHEVFGLLHKIPFFSGLSNSACITICARMKVMHIQIPRISEETDEKGQIKEGLIMVEGDDAEEMYIVIEGSKTIVLTKGGDPRTSQVEKMGLMSTGDFFGELGALLPPSMAEQRKRTRSAYAIGETQLGMLEYDDMVWLRRQSFEIGDKIVSYVNHVAEHLPGAEDREQPPLDMMDPFPELEMLQKRTDAKIDALDEKMDQVLGMISSLKPG